MENSIGMTWMYQTFWQVRKSKKKKLNRVIDLQVVIYMPLVAEITLGGSSQRVNIMIPLRIHGLPYLRCSMPGLDLDCVWLITKSTLLVEVMTCQILSRLWKNSIFIPASKCVVVIIASIVPTADLDMLNCVNVKFARHVQQILKMFCRTAGDLYQMSGRELQKAGDTSFAGPDVWERSRKFGMLFSSFLRFCLTHSKV